MAFIYKYLFEFSIKPYISYVLKFQLATISVNHIQDFDNKELNISSTYGLNGQKQNSEAAVNGHTLTVSAALNRSSSLYSHSLEL